MRVVLAAAMAALLTGIAVAAPLNLPGLKKLETLDGKPFSVPESMGGTPSVVIFAFEQDHDKPMAAWEAALRAPVKGKAQVYSIVVGSGAPFFVKGAIKKGVAKAHTESLNRTAVIFSDRDELYKGLNVRNDDAPLVLLLDGKGEVRARVQSTATPPAIATITGALQ